MYKYLSYIWLTLSVVLLQVFLLDNIDLGASISVFIRPMIFPLAVLLMPVEWKSIWVLLTSYGIALVLDLLLGGSGIYIFISAP